MCVWCLKTVLSPSDDLCGWDQAEWRPGSLEWSCSLFLPRGWPGGHWGIPAGALAGGPACSHTYDHDGPTNTHTLPPRHQDHRLAWWWWWRSTCEVSWSLYIYSLTGPPVCFSTENNWSGQHAYKWNYGSHTPNKEYKDLVSHLAWQSPHDSQWVSIWLENSTHYIFFIAKIYIWLLVFIQMSNVVVFPSGSHSILVWSSCIYWLRFTI